MKQNQKEVLSLWSAFNSTDLILKIKSQIWEKLFYIKGQSGEEGIMMARIISSQIEQKVHFFPASGEKEAEWTRLRFCHVFEKGPKVLGQVLKYGVGVVS